jgi:LysR family transcriptional regulator, nitrogen assimilation regulatory protein
MDVRQLKYFVGIVEAGSVSRAAFQLNIAQSALSQQLLSIEAELGVKLLIRGPNGMSLTDAGEVLYRHARSILRHVEIAADDVRSTDMTPSGTITLGLPRVLSRMLALPLFSAITTEHPKINLIVTDGISSTLKERLINGRLDIALLFIRPSERGLRAQYVLTEELFLVTASPDVPDEISFAELANLPLMLPSSSNTIRRAVEEAFAEREMPWSLVAEANSVDLLREAVKEGTAHSILPRAAMFGEIRGKSRFVRISSGELTRPLSLCTFEGVPESIARTAVVETMKKVIKRAVVSGRWEGVVADAAP